MATTRPEKVTISICNRTIKTAATLTTSSATARRFRGLMAPYALIVETSNVATAPTTPTIRVQVQDSADGTTYSSVSGFISTTISAAGTAGARASHAGELAEFIRARITTTFGTPNAGTRVKAWLVASGVG